MEFVCNSCDEEYSNSNLFEFDNRLWCTECLSEQTVLCDICNTRVYLDDTESDGDIRICVDCFDANYFWCSGCDRIYHNAHYHSEGLCESCFSAQYDNILRAYGYKPNWKFYTADTDSLCNNLFFGVELEFSFYSPLAGLTVARDVAEDINGYPVDAEKYCVLKQDGSLDNGFEIVTHPMTLNFWRLCGVDIFRSALHKIEAECDEEYPDGIHIHISRKGMSAGHKVRFGSFFAAYQAAMIKIADRYSERYADYKKIPYCGRDCINTIRNYDRYEAVNWENSSTVEIRIFRATADWSRIMAYIELCHAIYQYTKNSSITRILDGRAWQEFLEFVQAEPRYDHVYQYMQQLGFYGNI